MTSEYEAFLAHYGIKGQKWGHRRFQNEDGSLTEEGKIRYGVNGNMSERQKWMHDNPQDLSDDELNRRNSRMQREEQYRQNIANQDPLKKNLKSMLSDSAKKIFLATAVTAITAVVAKHYKDKAVPFIMNNAKHAINSIGTKLSTMYKRRSSSAIRSQISRYASNSRYKVRPMATAKIPYKKEFGGR